MRSINLNDTIAAISTPIGEAGIGIVRISGKAALAIADKIFVSKDKNKPSSFKTYTTHYGLVKDKEGNIVDEVILTLMRAPKSYTKEDIVEINGHAGIVALRKILDLVLNNGARLAQPGEFTRRAFLNGRIDLSEAEAVMDIIRAKTDKALKSGVDQLKGVLSKEVLRIRNAVSDVLVILEANIDFPEEEIDNFQKKKIAAKTDEINKRLNSLLSSVSRGRILREGVSTVICGRPNVGKSSLLNALLRQERSIVTPIAGTTRDTVEETFDIRGIPIKIVDTAGLIEPRDLIEKKAIKRTKEYIGSADLIILVFDASQPLSKQDKDLIKRLKKRNVIPVINKVDLRQRIDKEALAETFNNTVELSALKNKNINKLEDAVVKLVWDGKVSAQEGVFVTNLRHAQLLKKAQKAMELASNALSKDLSLEFIVEGLKESLDYLDELLGRKFSEDLLDKIFSQFCIGK